MEPLRRGTLRGITEALWKRYGALLSDYGTLRTIMEHHGACGTLQNVTKASPYVTER